MPKDKGHRMKSLHDKVLETISNNLNIASLQMGIRIHSRVSIGKLKENITKF